MRGLLTTLGALLLISGCGMLVKPPTSSVPSAESGRPADPRGHEIALFALGLVDTGYRFGGKNPEAGLDCSGMVSHVFEQAAGLRVSGSAADIAKQGRPVNGAGLRPGDLVFFNTRNRPRSHVGIYMGEGRMVHAPSSGKTVRVDTIDARYWAPRYAGAIPMQQLLAEAF